MEYSARFKVAGLNLLVSQFFITVFLVFAWLVWFPSPFALLSSFYKTAQIIILVNVFLGALLILIIYKKDKKHLKLDLSILAVIQLSAFIFGAYSLYLKHPVYVVFTVDRFTLINVAKSTPKDIRYQQLKSSFFSTPKLVFAKSPDNQTERNKLLFSVLFHGAPDLDERGKFYEPFDQHLGNVFSRSIDSKILFPDNPSEQKLLSFLEKNGGKAHDYAYFPLQGNNGKDVIWVLNRKTGKPIGAIDSDPWRVAQNKVMR